MTETFTPEFTEWPKTPRLFRDIVITEKIDGTNAAIGIRRLDWTDDINEPPADYTIVAIGDDEYAVYAQSRKRIISPTSDNYGFAGWVHANAQELTTLLGPGLHFGEWWGQGIQRRYGIDEKRFSLFNTGKWSTLVTRYVGPARVDTVPVLYQGVFDEAVIHGALRALQKVGSIAAPGFPTPEGVCVYHSQTRSVFKVTLDNYDFSKWEAAA